MKTETETETDKEKEYRTHFGDLIDEEALKLLIMDESGQTDKNEMSLEEIARCKEDSLDANVNVNANVNVKGKIAKINERRRANKHSVLTIFIKDEKEENMKLSLWDEAIAYAENLHEGYRIKVINGVVKKRGLNVEIEVNRWSTIEVLSEETSNYFFPLSRLPVNERVNVRGIVMKEVSIRSFLRNNDEIGVVGDTILNDGNEGVRLIAWGESVLQLKDSKKYDHVEIFNAKVKRNGRIVELHCDESTRMQLSE
jgi:DNA polymerase III alpha subunit